MIARLTFFNVQPGQAEELKKMYHEEIAPVIRKQKGNVGARLLEPADQREEHISLTEWSSKADADAYESSGMYKKLVDKVKSKFKGTPVLKTYSIAESKVMA